MKFEKITSEKFQNFHKAELSDLEKVVGGDVFTDNPKAQTHDDVVLTGQDTDSVSVSDYGSSD